MKLTHALKTMRTAVRLAAVVLLTAGLAQAAPAPDSKRLGHAKDLIADEQWARAIAELEAAADDPKETNRDEALFWLAHSQHQTGDDGAALQTIARLEKTAPSSRWVHPARSLRIEIAQRLRRDDVLWRTVLPPPPPGVPPAPAAPGAVPAVAPAVPARPASAPRPAAPPAPPSPATPIAVPAPPPPPLPAAIDAIRAPRLPHPAVPVPPEFDEYWTSPGAADMTLKIQALTGLLETHSEQVIPLLREIALDRNSPDEARQAVFALGQSRRPEAERTVVDLARAAAEPVRVAAVRELGRFEGPGIGPELMQVYSMGGTPRLKRQIVASLGERADSASLLRIAKSEEEPTVRDYAIITLGRTGSRDQLRTLYVEAPQVSRGAVLLALFAARDDDELIRIAKTETSVALRQRARQQLRMLATPKALKFLEDNP
jgi:hypothetical protein